MENITKALLIAAGVLIAIILTTLLVIGYNQISGYYQEQSNVTEVKQIIEMSKKFVNYEEKEIRGNEMLSVINMVEDYNEWVKQNPNEGYKIIKLDISFKNVRYAEGSKYEVFHIDEKQGIDYLLPKKLSNNSITESNASIFSTRVIELLSDLKNLVKSDGFITNPNVISESTLQLLSSNVHNINYWLDDSTTSNLEQRYEDNLKIAKLLDNIVKTKIIDSVKNSKELESKLNANKKTIQNLRIIACKYYEITQFKRAYFICTKIKQDSSGRVTLMNFEIETTNGSVKFN